MQKSLATKVSMLKQMSKPEKKSSGLTVESAQQPQLQQPAEKNQNVKVIIRIRPMNEAELARGDPHCINFENENTLSITQKGTQRSYKFNEVLSAGDNQQKAYQRCRINQLIDAAIDGYSATIFAYGQTGSGKTYTMSGNEEIFARQVYRQDERSGIIPRAIQQLWKKIKEKKSKFAIKASYTQIYNEQIKDLLNLSSGVLHCRWNPANGFFVEDLIVVDCSNVDDMISVLVQGIKNRKSGSHELNKDSSRSHSILTLYIISEVTQGNQSAKKYGKISFVDLAGSERLKESKSQGDMIKETANINKSLFTLGKVIKGLTDKKEKTPYIPYRDSKLTMLLMDSLGGNSKTLMIACTSPSAAYLEETLSTLNYAARTMNIRNKPMIQMDQKDQIIQQIQAEIEQLRKENVYLREQYQRVSKGLPLKIPDLRNDLIKTSFKQQPKQSQQLPPLQSKQLRQSKVHSTSLHAPEQAQAIILDYQLKFDYIKKENELMRRQKDDSEEKYKKMMENNTIIQSKLENLEQIFLEKRMQPNENDNEIVTSGLLHQNTELKKYLRDVEKEKMNIGFDRQQQPAGNASLIRTENEQLQKQIEKMQQRQKELLQELQHKKLK